MSMANGFTAEDHVTLNQGSGGPVIATDYVGALDYGDGSNPAHIQIIKLSTSGAGGGELLSTDNPAPVQVYMIGDTNVSNGFIAVRGNTFGDQAVPVSLSGATLEISDITIVGGTLDRLVEGVSADIRSINAGITLSVVGVGGNNSVSVTGDVLIGTGVSADIRSLPLPTGITSFSSSFDQNTLKTFSTFTLSSGVKVKNYYSGLEGFTAGFSGPGGGILCVGYTGTLSAGGSSGFLLAPGEEVFIEIDNTNRIVATSVNYSGAESYVIMSVLGT